MGMTLKQMARKEFWDALAAYKTALQTKVNIVGTSVRIHAAKAGVPKRLWPLVNKTFKST
jgi:hypothetical protein